MIGIQDGRLRETMSVPDLGFHSLFLSLMVAKTRYCTIDVNGIGVGARRIVDLWTWEDEGQEEAEVESD